MASLEQIKKDIVKGIVDRQLNGHIPEIDLAKAVDKMPAGDYVQGRDGLVEENVFDRSTWDQRKKGHSYRFNPHIARQKGYL